MVSEFQDFNWQSCEAANGRSGEGLAASFVRLVQGLGSVERICDLGCGNGYLAGQLASLGYKVTGVDASQSGIELAKKNWSQAKFICKVINNQLPSEMNGDRFDLIVSSDVIEHLYRPADLLEAANGLLEPGGRLILGTPYHGYLKNLALSISGRMDSHFSALWDGGHIKFFSVDSLSKIITQQGFTDLKFCFYGRAPYLWKNMICHARKAGERRNA